MRRKTRNFISAITHEDTETAAVFERSFLKTFGGDCQIPLGCCAEVHLGKVSANSVFIDIEKLRSPGTPGSATRKKHPPKEFLWPGTLWNGQGFAIDPSGI